MRNDTEDDPREVFFTKDVTRGEICAFEPGYLEFLAETNHTVNSVLGFMPGVRVSIATSIYDFHVYNRWEAANNMRRSKSTTNHGEHDLDTMPTVSP